MAKIFAQDASQQDFNLVVSQLREGCKVADQVPMIKGSISKDIGEIETANDITEEQFNHIIDKSSGWLEDSPWRLTVPEIHYFCSQVSRFGDLVKVLSKYGYAKADLFQTQIQNYPSRFDILTKILSQPDFLLINLSPELRDDKHFIIALIQSKSDFYNQLSFEEQSDPDNAVNYINTKLVEEYGYVTGIRPFDSVPDILRFDPVFLQKCKTMVSLHFGKNLIPPENFYSLWQSSTPPNVQLTDFNFWIDFYDGAEDYAFAVAIQGNIISKEMIKNDFLTRVNASDFYKQLPNGLKADVELIRMALKHDSNTFFYLPRDSQLLKEAETWFMVAGADGSYNNYAHPDFPNELLNNSELVNKIVASHPELLDVYRDQPEKLKQILSQLTPENVIAFVSAVSEAFDLLPEKLKHNLHFAKKVVNFQSYSQAAEKLFEIHEAKLAIYEIEKNPDIISRIPKDVLNLPEVDQAVREQIRALQEKEMPYWTKQYFEDHPDQVPNLIESKPDWFEELLASYDPGDASKKDLPLTVAKAHFDSFVTTPERMRAYLSSLPYNQEQTINDDLLNEVRLALIKYSGKIDYEVSHDAKMAIYGALGGRYEKQHPEYPEDVIRLLLNKYHVAPLHLEWSKMAPFINFENKNSLLFFLERSSCILSNESLALFYNVLKEDIELIYKVVESDVRILQIVSENEWQKLGPDLVTYIDGELTLLASTYALLPENLRSDKNLALRAVVADSDNYFYLPKFLLQDQAFMTELCGWADVPVYDFEKMSPSAQVASIARFPSRFHLVAPELRNTPNLIQDVLAQNMWLYYELTADEQTRAWPGFKEQLTQNGFLFTEVNSWDDFVAILRTKSVAPKRIRSLEGWKIVCPDLFSVTAKFQDGDGHRVLILVSKEDLNGAFTAVPLVDRLVALGIQNIDYREVGSETDVKRILAESKARGTTYDEIFIAGHGTQNSLALGGADRAHVGTPAINDDMYIDFSDFDDDDFDFGSVLKKGGRLIALSCSNGEGADKEANLANHFATTLKTDQLVVASQIPANITYMDIDPTGHILVYWMGNAPYLPTGTKSP